MQATEAHCVYVAEHARLEDMEEAHALYDVDLETGLVMSMNSADEAFTLLANDTPVAVFGVTPSDETTCLGHPWLIATPRLREVSVPFLRHGSEVVGEWLHRYGMLQNYVGACNTDAIRWLRGLGFEVLDDRLMTTPSGYNFYEFIMRGPSNVS